MKIKAAVAFVVAALVAPLIGAGVAHLEIREIREIREQNAALYAAATSTARASARQVVVVHDGACAESPALDRMLVRQQHQADIVVVPMPADLAPRPADGRCARWAARSGHRGHRDACLPPPTMPNDTATAPPAMSTGTQIAAAARFEI